MSSYAPPVPLQAGDALVIVDVQSDFLAGGSLAVPRGNEVIAVLNGYLAAFQQAGLPVLATRDWAPERPLLLPAARRAVATALRGRQCGSQPCAWAQAAC